VSAGFDVRTRTIAVIDDVRVLELLVNLLVSFGYKADKYQSAEQFLESGELAKMNCIVTDVKMQHMSGLGLLQCLKNRNSDVPVVIITGRSSDRSESFYLKKGAAGFFRKPVDSNTLLDLAGSLCGHAHSEPSRF
jgi:FixJ family two-component response regulator